MVGVDIVYIPEFERQLKLGRDAFLQDLFSESEIKNQTLEHLAGIWAAKEAVIKALGASEKDPENISIRYNKSGQPYAEVGSIKLEISIAHHGEYAVAVAMAK